MSFNFMRSHLKKTWMLGRMEDKKEKRGGAENGMVR